MKKFGIWSFSRKSGIVRRGKKEQVQLEPRLATLFALLFERVNEIVTRDELVVGVWPDTIVNDDSLTRAVSDLRKVLKEHFFKPPKIKTMHKRGYKMLIPKDELGWPIWLKILKYTIYFIIGFVLLMLVIRGLHYE